MTLVHDSLACDRHRKSCTCQRNSLDYCNPFYSGRCPTDGEGEGCIEESRIIVPPPLKRRRD